MHKTKHFVLLTENLNFQPEEIFSRVDVASLYNSLLKMIKKIKVLYIPKVQKSVTTENPEKSSNKNNSKPYFSENEMIFFKVCEILVSFMNKYSEVIKEPVKHFLENFVFTIFSKELEGDKVYSPLIEKSTLFLQNNYIKHYLDVNIDNLDLIAKVYCMFSMSETCSTRSLALQGFADFALKIQVKFLNYYKDAYRSLQESFWVKNGPESQRDFESCKERVVNVWGTFQKVLKGELNNNPSIPIAIKEAIRVEIISLVQQWVFGLPLKINLTEAVEMHELLQEIQEQDYEKGQDLIEKDNKDCMMHILISLLKIYESTYVSNPSLDIRISKTIYQLHHDESLLKIKLWENLNDGLIDLYKEKIKKCLQNGK